VALCLTPPLAARAGVLDLSNVAVFDTDRGGVLGKVNVGGKPFFSRILIPFVTQFFVKVGFGSTLKLE
jgi:hypothetical protein